MILPNSIISAFTEKGTLLKWLKKVEAALKADVLTDISLNQISETQVTIKLTFADGSSVESPVLTMPKGKEGAAATVKVGTTTTGEAGTAAVVTNTGTESAAVLNFIIPKGKDGKDGKDGQGVAATVEVGKTTTGNAGTAAQVENVGTAQDAVLNFTIPRGNTGEKGDPGTNGTDGVGFNNATKVEENAGITAISETAAGMTVNGYYKITAGGETFEIPSVFHLPVKGSETIVIDVDESGTYFDVHLDAAIVTKLSKALVTPAQAPESVTLVAIGTNGAQTAVTIGDGLEIVNGVLQVKAASQYTLTAGTYQFIENPSLDITVEFDIAGKMNTLTADNTYGDVELFDFISCKKTSSAESGFIGVGNENNSVQFSENRWTYNYEYTATDTSKLRTITIETDQQVPQSFYDWAITQGNLVKQSTGETWVLNETLIGKVDISQDINFTSNNESFVHFSVLIGLGVDLQWTRTDLTTFNPVTESSIWGNVNYRTVTFSTAPTGDLLTWLQANGTKQG